MSQSVVVVLRRARVACGGAARAKTSRTLSLRPWLRFESLLESGEFDIDKLDLFVKKGIREGRRLEERHHEIPRPRRLRRL